MDRHEALRIIKESGLIAEKMTEEEKAAKKAIEHLDRRVALRGAQKNESTIVDSFEDFLLRVDRFLWKAGYESDEIEDYIAEHYDKLKAAFEDGKTADDAVYNI